MLPRGFLAIQFSCQLAQLVVSKMDGLYDNATVQPRAQDYPYYVVLKTKVHTFM